MIRCFSEFCISFFFCGVDTNSGYHKKESLYQLAVHVNSGLNVDMIERIKGSLIQKTEQHHWFESCAV